jgi:hypothetical protein
MTQAEKFYAAQAAVKSFMFKHGNVCLLPDTKKNLNIKARFYQLQDAASDAYWTSEMEAALVQKEKQK